jgi:ceramide glucosyltransferase
MWIATSLLALLVAGSLVYCVLVVIAARRYLAVRPAPAAELFPVSILKPLAGADEGLEDNLRSFFTQDYPRFEILFAVRYESDPAAAIVRGLQAEYPAVPARLLSVGDPPYPNAKVWSLERMTELARHDLLVMSDSDIRVTPGMLKAVAAEFQDPELGVASCPYRAVPGGSFWSMLEAIGMNTEFLAGVLVARLVEGVRFALGPTSIARRQAVQAAGGWRHLAEFLAEDFVLGNLAAKNGWRVILSSYVIEHRIGAQSLRGNAKHRLRWYRSTRRSRPAGYIGQLFTNPLPVAVFLCLLQPSWWPLGAVTVLLRAAAAWATAVWVLRVPAASWQWIYLPLQDLISFGFWIAGFFGNTILWRGRRYVLLRDGRFRLVS